MSFENSILQIAPPWLLGDTGAKFLRTIGATIDTAANHLKDGVKARFPSTAPVDALAYIGKDRNLEQGPLEPADDFRNRLVAAIPTAKRWGSAESVLRQLAGFFDGIGTPPIRVVTDASVWHEYDWTTGNVIKSVGARDNVGYWNWDGTRKWWRGWVVIDGASLGWLPWNSGSGIPMDGSYVMGSTTPPAYVEAIQRLVQKWKPANVYVPRIILTFCTGLYCNPPDLERAKRGPFGRSPFRRMFLKTPSNPKGQFDDPQYFDDNATYWLGGGEEP